MKHAFLVAAVLVVASCKKSNDAKPAAGSGSGSAKVATPADAAPVAKAERPKRPPPTKEQKIEFKKRMAAGWAQQKDKKWAEAATEFEAALVAIPDEQRALTELGWSAMNAGDFKKARVADELSIAVAVDKKVKAAGYFNLGAVQEKTGDKDGALKSYTASLALRPNKIVASAITKLGANAAEPPPACDAKMTPCECAYTMVFGMDEESSTCKETAATGDAAKLTGWKTFVVAEKDRDEGGNSYAFLFDEAGHFASGLDAVSEHGRHYETDKVDKIEVRTVGGHQVAWIQTSYTDEATFALDDGMEMDELHGTFVTICVVGDGKTPTVCPLRNVPLSSQHDISYLPDEPGAPMTQKDSSQKTVLDIVIVSEGIATVKIISGPSDEQIQALVGPKKLW